MRYIWGGSPEYTFEPKDNMTLQILFNQRMSNWSGILLIIAMILNIVQMSFIEKGKGFVLSICLLFLIVPVFIRRNRNFIIKEVYSNETWLDKETLHTTSGLASVGVYARGKFRGNLKVLRPFELLCSPARTPSRRNVVRQYRERCRKSIQFRKSSTARQFITFRQCSA